LQKENIQRVIEAKKHRAEFTELTETIQTQQTFDTHHHATTKARRCKPDYQTT
jgi:hypothetical protein